MAKRKSRKARVKELFETQGIQAAWTLGLKLGLKPTSLRVWFSRWHHAANDVKQGANTSEIQPR